MEGGESGQLFSTPAPPAMTKAPRLKGVRKRKKKNKIQNRGDAHFFPALRPIVGGAKYKGRD